MTEIIPYTFNLIDIILIFSSVYIHEYGHYFSAKIMGLTPVNIDLLKLRVTTRANNKYQVLIFLSSAIIIGFIPILFISDQILKYLILIVYFFGACSTDITNIIGVIFKFSLYNISQGNLNKPEERG